MLTMLLCRHSQKLEQWLPGLPFRLWKLISQICLFKIFVYQKEKIWPSCIVYLAFWNYIWQNVAFKSGNPVYWCPLKGRESVKDKVGVEFFRWHFKSEKKSDSFIKIIYKRVEMYFFLQFYCKNPCRFKKICFRFI